MKYIKLYESFNRDIEDILLEITDIGYEYKIYENKSIYYITINKCSTWTFTQLSIDFDDIKDCLLRLKDYLGDRYVGCDFSNRNELSFKKVELNEDTKIDEDVVIFYIHYK